MSAKSDTRCTLHGDGKLALCINHQLRQLRDGPEHCMLHESCDRSVLGLGCPIEVGSDIRCRYVSRTTYRLSGGQKKLECKKETGVNDAACIDTKAVI